MSTALQTTQGRAVNPFAALQTQQQPRQQYGAIAAAEQQRAIAETQAALIIARQCPRDPMAAMDKILMDCTRRTLAEKALYTYSRGGQEVSGPSIRLAEAIALKWENLHFSYRELSRTIGPDGVGVSEVEAWAWDQETNTKKSIIFNVRHWRDTKQGGKALKDERDIYELIANMASRRVRNCILAIVPGDVVEAAVDQCDQTLKANADTSPAAVGKMVEAFAEFGVSKDAIAKKIQCRIDAIRPAQMVMLRKIYVSLKDGMGAPEDFFDLDTPDPSTLTPTELLKKTIEQSPEVQKVAAKAKAPAPQPESAPQPAPAPVEEDVPLPLGTQESSHSPECAAWSPQDWNDWEMGIAQTLFAMTMGQDVTELWKGEKDRLDWLLAHDKRRWANAKKVFDQTADRLA